MKIKKVLGLLLGCIAGILSLCSCSTDEGFAAGDFSCEKIDETSIAIGNIRRDYSSDIVFVPAKLNGYTVKKLGYASGLGFGGSGYLTWYVSETETLPGYRLQRFYCPNTITDIMLGYMKYTQDMKVFYCGTILNIVELVGDKTKFYVPNEWFDDFYNEIDDVWKGSENDLYRANVAYMLNYETENPYYYVDDYEYGMKIEFIPPVPEREGYTFAGWYREAEGLNEWKFTLDALPVLEEDMEYRETKLYAKWRSV